MRDVLVISLVAMGCAAALLHPWVGVMTWTWISIMNPHSLAWAAASMPLGAITVGATLIGMIITRDRLNFFLTRETLTLLAFMAWVTVSLLLAFSPEDSFEMWFKVMKIDFMILVSLVVLHSKRHIMIFAAVVVVSLGFYGVKGGVFTLATAGAYRVWGPGGFIGGNNELALALIVVIPMMRFLQLQSASKWIRHGLTVAMVLTAIAALGSQSRGAFIAIIAMGIYLWLRSGTRLVFGLGILALAVAVLQFMPESWEARIATIRDYEQDASAMGRLNAWGMAINLAGDRLTGGGFDIYTPEIFVLYAPDPSVHLAAHSIYFQVLGEHGYPGLAIYLLMWWFVWRSSGQLARLKKEPATAWCRDLGAMTQASLVGYFVGGAFLSLAYFDLPYDLLVLVVLARRWIARRGWQSEGTERADTAQAIAGARAR